MIFSPSFRKTIFISLLGHITLFSIFSFSFGHKIPKVDYTGVSFWGAILQSSDLTPPFLPGRGTAQQERAGLISRENFKSQDTKEIFMRKFNTKPIDKTNREYPCLSSYYLNPVRDTTDLNDNAIVSNGVKPAAIVRLNEDKIIFVQKKTPLLVSPTKKAQAIMFYPLLPYHFLLYFKDRQVAHIELVFKIISSPRTNSMAVKRKISSGNLEADLLAMRYISHYLFIQQAGFPMNDWQTVKIELSPKDDKH